MFKRLMSLLLALLMLLPAMASAELTYEREEKKYINFPEMDQWRGHFTKVNNWTIVTADTLEDHMDLLLARGDSEKRSVPVLLKRRCCLRHIRPIFRRTHASVRKNSKTPIPARSGICAT